MLSRNFWGKSVRENFYNFHTLCVWDQSTAILTLWDFYCHQYFGKNSWNKFFTIRLYCKLISRNIFHVTLNFPAKIVWNQLRSVLNALILRNFCEKAMRVNFRNIHLIKMTQCGNFTNFPPFQNFSVKLNMEILLNLPLENGYF